uniref:Kelch domain containing 8A n=1 Tax=Zonotrichia albicollis TaxID=44394 RepID=A0A8D2M5Q1_ZONAL
VTPLTPVCQEILDSRREYFLPQPSSLPSGDRSCQEEPGEGPGWGKGRIQSPPAPPASQRMLGMGGTTISERCSVVEMYNTDEGRWRKRSSLREAAMGISLTLRGGHGYLRGGGRQSKYAVNAFEVFDTDTRSWTRFPNIPTKRAFSSFVPTEEKLFSLGGLRQGRLYRQPKFMRTVDVFDLEQGGSGWMKMERSCYLKKRRADFVAGYLRGRVVVAGGLGNQPSVLESAEAFHPEKNKWESLPPMPTPRCACSSIVLRDCLLAVGGVSQGLSTAVEALCLSDS